MLAGNRVPAHDLVVVAGRHERAVWELGKTPDLAVGVRAHDVGLGARGVDGGDGTIALADHKVAGGVAVNSADKAIELDGVDSSWADRVIWLPFQRTIALPNRPNKKRGGVSALVNLRWFPGSAASGQAGDQAWDVRPAVPASLSTVLGVSPACMQLHVNDRHQKHLPPPVLLIRMLMVQDVPSHCPHRPSGGCRRAVPRVAVQRWEHQHGDPRR